MSPARQVPMKNATCNTSLCHVCPLKHRLTIISLSISLYSRQETDDGEDKEKNKADARNYYGTAHTIKEEVTEQPTILEGGTLKEYQVK